MTETLLPPTYSTRAAVAATGLSYRQVDYLARNDVVRPSVVDASGSGSRRLYDEDDLRLLGAVGALCRLGAEGDTLRAAAGALRLLLDLGDWRGPVVVDVDGRVYAGANTPPSGAGWHLDLDRVSPELG